MKDQVVDLIEQSIRAIQAKGTLPEGELPTPQVDHTRDPKHGDLATNAAMVLAKSRHAAARLGGSHHRATTPK